MKIKFFLCLLAASVLTVSTFAASKKKKKDVAPAGDVEVVIPCSGLEFTSSAEYFRANAVGVSTSVEVAAQKAMSSARAKLAAAIETTVKSLTDNFMSSYTENDKEEVRGRFMSLSREAVSQKLSGIRTICQKTMKSPEGQYKSYVAVELAGKEIADAMKARISDDSKLRTDFEYKKFEETFDKEMEALAKAQ